LNCCSQLALLLRYTGTSGLPLGHAPPARMGLAGRDLAEGIGEVASVSVESFGVSDCAALADVLPTAVMRRGAAVSTVTAFSNTSTTEDFTMNNPIATNLRPAFHKVAVAWAGPALPPTAEQRPGGLQSQMLHYSFKVWRATCSDMQLPTCTPGHLLRLHRKRRT
jgi:hypothetical protein